MAKNILRHVKLDGYTLKLWLTDHFDDRNRRYTGYEFKNPKGKVIFKAEDYSSSPMSAYDSDEAVRGLIGFLTLRPGDTDDDYFKKYNKTQMDFANSRDAEELQMYGMEDDGEGVPELIDIKPKRRKGRY